MFGKLFHNVSSKNKHKTIIITFKYSENIVSLNMLVYGLLTLLGLVCVEGTPDNPIMSYDFLYREGVDSYLSEKWESCVKNIEMALEDWHWWRENIIRCRRDCSKEGRDGVLYSSGLSEDESFMEKTVRSTLCLVKCKKAVFGSRMDRVAEGHVDEDFDMRKPYDYLQLCYYKLDKIKEAADAAATVLAQKPEHEVMKNNLKFYLTKDDIPPESVVNRELKKYGRLYIQGNTAYNNNDYAGTINLMEESLREYYRADDDCRKLCEKPFDQGWFPDFISSVANHYTFTLRCKRRCAFQLSNLYGEPIEHFFASYFNYLQYSYYQEGEYKKAYESVASALVLTPDDEVQLRNKEFYIKENAEAEELLVPRKDVLEYKKQLDFEEKMIEFIETSFIFLNDEEFLEDVDENQVEIAGDKKTLSVVDMPIDANSVPSSFDSKKGNATKVTVESQNTLRDEL
ncbi:procollagen-proline 3-dioxygenase activity protein [Halocaridina rubra]|uniref:Procollagen-proline 3-dioxygenase activity protein n=1 Tax=Halocaridina rubra TaxID=373956 RepID=A0AAN8WN96_HALRR